MKEIAMNSAMPLNCSDAKHLIHLDVGDDLRSEEEQKLAVHMGQCGDCRSYHASMSNAMSALLTLRDNPLAEAPSVNTKSVWPALSREINRRNTSPRIARKFNVQVVALSVCSLSLAVVTMVQSLSSMRDYDEPVGFMPAQSVSNYPQSVQHQTLPFTVPQQYGHGNPAAQSERTPLLPHETPVSAPQSF